MRGRLLPWARVMSQIFSRKKDVQVDFELEASYHVVSERILRAVIESDDFEEALSYDEFLEQCDDSKIDTMLAEANMSTGLNSAREAKCLALKHIWELRLFLRRLFDHLKRTHLRSRQTSTDNKKNEY